jgi:hypothetical protein
MYMIHILDCLRNWMSKILEVHRNKNFPWNNYCNDKTPNRLDIQPRLLIGLAMQFIIADALCFLHIFSGSVSKTRAIFLFIWWLSSYTCWVHFFVSIRPCLRLCLCFVHILSSPPVSPVQNLTIHRRHYTHITSYIAVRSDCHQWLIKSTVLILIGLQVRRDVSDIPLTQRTHCETFRYWHFSFVISTSLTCWRPSRRQKHYESNT